MVMKKQTQPNWVSFVCVSESCNYRHTYSFRTPRDGPSGWKLSCFKPHTCHGEQRAACKRPRRSASEKQKERERYAALVAACRSHDAAADPVKPLTLAHARTFWAEGNLDEALQLLPTSRAHAEVLVASYNEVQGKLVREWERRQNRVGSVCVSKSCNYRHAYSFHNPRNGRSGWKLSCFEPHTCHGEAESRGRANPPGPAQSGDRPTG
jgi:hypothetical protein